MLNKIIPSRKNQKKNPSKNELLRNWITAHIDAN